MKKVLPFFSYLFHPIFIPTLGTLFYIFYSKNYYLNNSWHLLLFQVVIISFFLPLAFFYLLRIIGMIDSIMIANVSQRKMPLLLQIMLSLVLISKTITKEFLPELYSFFLAGIISASIAFILVYFKIKASIHMIAISALTFFVTLCSYFWGQNRVELVCVLFLLSGVIASSRLFMKAHTIKELAIGYCAGMIPQIAVFYYLVYKM